MKKKHLLIKIITLIVASGTVTNYVKAYDTTSVYSNNIEDETHIAISDEIPVASGNCGADSGKANVTWQYYDTTKTLVISGTGKIATGTLEFSAYKSEIEKVVFEGEITEIRTSMFSSYSPNGTPLYSKLKTVDLSALTKLEKIGAEAFYKDEALEQVIMPTYSPLTTIESKAFMYCTKLSTIDLSSNTLQSIGDNAFYFCTVLKTIVFGNGLQTIGLAAFYRSGLVNIDLSKCVNLSSIGGEAFYSNANLNKVTFPLNDKLKTLSTGMFKSCKSLKEIDLSNLINLETINEQLLYLTSIEKITLPTRIKQIETNALSPTSTLVFHIKSQSAMENWDDEIDTVKTLQAFSPSLLKTINVHLDEEGVLKVGDYKSLNVTTNIMLNDKAIPVKWQSDNDKIVRVDTNGTVEGIAEGSATITATIDTTYWSSSLQATKTITVDNYGKVSDSGNCGNESGGSNVSWKYYENTKTLVVSGNGATINGKAAFNKYQTDIEHVVFKGDITKIGTSFLSQYLNIQTIDISALENLEEIGIEAFYKCQELVTISFPQNEKITSIGESAFKECSKLTKVDLSKLTKLNTLSSKVFRLCSRLEDVVLHDSVQTISQEAFLGCKELSSINLSVSSLESIETKAFVDCAKLTNIEFGSGMKRVDNLAFSNTGLENVDMSKSTRLESLGAEAFYNCGSLTTISFPTTNTSLTILNAGLFKNCSNLKKIDMTGMRRLETLALNVFKTCTSLEEVKLPATLKSIPTELFYQCSKLQQVNFEELTDLVSIEEAAFARTALTDVNLSKSRRLETIGNKAFMTSTNIKSVELPDSVKTIGGYAFANIEKLKEITLPASLETIGEKAFYVQNDWTGKYISKLEKVDFSNCDKLQLISDSCFQDVSSLTFVDLGNCKSLTTIEEDFLRGTNVSRAILPESITSIGRNSFNKNKMEINIVSANKEWGDTIDTLQSLNSYSNSNGNCYLKLKELNLEKSDYSSGDEIKIIPVFENNIMVNGHNIPLKYVISNSTLVQINDDGKIITHCLKDEEKATSTIKATFDTVNWNSPIQSAEVNIEVMIVHHFNNWATVEQPTHEKEGLSQRICQDCLQIETKTVDKLPPVPDIPNEDKPNTDETENKNKPDFVQTGDALYTFEYFLITMVSLLGVFALYRKLK